MGVDTPVWRARCGLFRSGKSLSVNKSCDVSEKSERLSFEFGVIIAILLTIGCVELNPGPVTHHDMETMREQLQDEITSLRNHVNQQVQQQTKVIESMQVKIQNLTSENINLKQKVNVLDRQLRKNNVIIFGVPDSENESCQDIVQNICDDQNINLDHNQIQDAFRLGRNKGRRPILCKLNSFNKKREILQKTRQCVGIKILNDLSKQDREDLKFLKPYADCARKNGQRAVIRGDKLIIEGHATKKSDLAGNHPQVVFGNRVSASSPRQSTMRDQPPQDAAALTPPTQRDITQAATVPVTTSRNTQSPPPPPTIRNVTPSTSADHSHPAWNENEILKYMRKALFDKEVSSDSDDGSWLGPSPTKRKDFNEEIQSPSPTTQTPVHNYSRGRVTRGRFPRSRGRGAFKHRGQMCN